MGELMNSMIKWNAIVEQFNKNKKSKENVIQSLWEGLFAQIFGYNSFLGFLDAQKSFQIGNSGSIKPDIILKNSSGPVCAIELKQETITLTDKIQSQLFSYLKQTKIDTGVIIADKIYLYAYEYSKNDDNQSFIEIDFIKDNKEGELFVDLMTFDSFNSKAISDFVNEKINHLNNVSKIKENLSKNLVLDALGKYFENQYTDDEIQEALAEFEINISKKKLNNIVNKNEIKEESKPNVSVSNINLDSQILLNGGKTAKNYLEKIFNDNGKFIDYFFTVAKLNKNGKIFWANPDIDCLKKNWCLILNYMDSRELRIFSIPADSINASGVKTRVHQGKILIDLEILFNDVDYTCRACKIKFAQWYVETLKY